MQLSDMGYIVPASEYPDLATPTVFRTVQTVTTDGAAYWQILRTIPAGCQILNYEININWHG